METVSTSIEQFIPLLLISIILAAIMTWIAAKLEKNRVLWFVLSVIPFVNIIFIWVAIWTTVIDLFRRLKAIEERLGASNIQNG